MKVSLPTLKKRQFETKRQINLYLTSFTWERINKCITFLNKNILIFFCIKYLNFLYEYPISYCLYFCCLYGIWPDFQTFILFISFSGIGQESYKYEPIRW